MSFLDRKKIGLILRVFATKPEQVADRVKQMQAMIEHAAPIMIGDHKVFSRIDVLVWADDRYGQAADCGLTAEALRQVYPRQSGSIVHISEVKHGDLFCGLLNYGVAMQSRNRIDYSVIASSEAATYMTAATMSDMIKAADSGALAIGVAINELTDSILVGGCVANTFAMWDNISLQTVGSFDPLAQKPADEREADYKKGHHPAKGDVYYQLAGVEEVIPLARMIDAFGPCVAPLLPRGEGLQRYQVPDPTKDPELWERHVSKMGTKEQRQRSLLDKAGYDISYLAGGIMPDYRQ